MSWMKFECAQHTPTTDLHKKITTDIKIIERKLSSKQSLEGTTTSKDLIAYVNT